MKWFIITTTAACLLLAACGGSDGSATGSAANSTENSSQSQQQVSNSASNSANPYYGFTVGRCSTTPDQKLDETADAGLQISCDDADDSGFDFEAHKVEVREDSGLNAVVRVTGYSESCEYDCPGEIYTDVTMFRDSNHRWDISIHERLNLNWDKPQERIDADNAAAVAVLNQISCSVGDKSPILDSDYNMSFDTTVSVESAEGVYGVDLKVDLPGYPGAIFYSNYSTSQQKLEFMPSSDYRDPQPGLANVKNVDNAVVAVRACRLMGTTGAKGDWQAQ